MKKFRFLLALLLASFGSIQMMRAAIDVQTRLWADYEIQFESANYFNVGLSNNGGWFYSDFLYATDISADVSGSFMNDDEATLAFGYTIEDAQMSLSLYVDDELISTFEGATDASYHTFATKVSAGEHQVKWVTNSIKSTSKRIYLYYPGLLKGDWVDIIEECGIPVNISSKLDGDDVASVRLFGPDPGLRTDGSISFTLSGESQKSVFAVVEAAEPARFYFCKSNDDALNLTPYIDGESYSDIQVMDVNDRFYTVDVTSGRHIFKLDMKNSSGYQKSIIIGGMRIMASSTITVDLKEPGSLGTEVLYNVSHVNDVRKLIVKGRMNDEDWARITLMTNLISLDLSEAQASGIPAQQFKNISPNKNMYLTDIKLPKTLASIGDNAFLNSNISRVQWPESLGSIGTGAFSNSLITDAILPDDVASIGTSAFSDCGSILSVHYPTSITSVPDQTFSGCGNLKEINLEEGLTEIGHQAFRYCGKLDVILPQTIQRLGFGAFQASGIKNVELAEGVEIEGRVFMESAIESAALPSTFFYPRNVRASNNAYFDVTQWLFKDCKNLKDLYLKCPNVFGETTKYGIVEGCSSDLNVHVPDFMVNAYKLDSYWYNYNIVGYSSADQKDWTLQAQLVLNRERIGGTPNLALAGADAKLKVNGDDSQTIDNLTVDYNAQLLSNCDNVSINGQLKNRYTVEALKWYFISLPFNIKVSDIVMEGGAQYAIRYYDGANRAANGASGSWKNYESDAVIPAGQGFIFQASKADYVVFTAQDNASKQNIVSNSEFVMQLAANESETAANKGWNLVGNPWQTYYNIHKLNFTAPITVWNGSNRTYEAYSIQDDDYALTPNQAFFVQCPDEITEISFPTDGRQLSSEITDQNGVKAFAPVASTRQLIDLTLTSGDLSDRTRVVLNEDASQAFEMTRDAQKMMSMDASVPQLFSVEADGMEYAINERPVAEGAVQLGFSAAQAGVYTIAATRCQAATLILEDIQTGAKTDLTQEGYTFTADAGRDTQRFVLRLGRGDTATGVDGIDTKASEPAAIYDLGGRRTDASRHGMYIQKGQKVVR